MADAAPVVSCIVATNRASPFLDEALRSVGAQTHPRLDMVVVDDGSPDPSALARMLTAHPAVTLVRVPPSGVASARNTGVRHARGEILAFLDDDDRWEPDRVALHVEALGRSSAASASYGDLRTIDAAGRVMGEPDQFDATTADIVARRVTVMLPNLVVRRSAFDAVGGFDERLTLAEDLDLVLKLTGIGPLVYARGAISDYRTHDGNVTRRHRALAEAIRLVIARRRDADPRHADDYAVSLRANDRFAWWSAQRAAKAALRGRHPWRAVSEVAWAARFAPAAPADAVARRLIPGASARG
ncbi:glycosyltransferase family 2 protein [Demequina muriae]|uniref:Glycosyltransferase family A protein n=1 Tax=Demequina muriae TaxID=3051664 RepID=A0ABT8GJX7_9MICO|nr:glycosyltransferase family A protein [Demequina sp. EGI L300058]MDN4481743.1 glycosyltransferase family A protein [Demequina sp. EGI L300058]